MGPACNYEGVGGLKPKWIFLDYSGVVIVEYFCGLEYNAGFVRFDDFV